MTVRPVKSKRWFMLLPRRMKARRYTLRGIGAKTTGGCKDSRVLPFSDRIMRQDKGSAAP
jgi:hypothetical protein